MHIRRLPDGTWDLRAGDAGSLEYTVGQSDSGCARSSYGHRGLLQLLAGKEVKRVLQSCLAGTVGRSSWVADPGGMPGHWEYSQPLPPACFVQVSAVQHLTEEL